MHSTWMHFLSLQVVQHLQRCRQPARIQQACPLYAGWASMRRLHRGCVCAVAASLRSALPPDCHGVTAGPHGSGGQGPLELEWLSVAEVADRLHSPSLLHAVCTYDQQASLLIAIHIPAKLLSGILFQDKAAAGVVGWARVATQELSVQLARYCFAQLIQEKGPEEGAALAAALAAAGSKRPASQGSSSSGGNGTGQAQAQGGAGPAEADAGQAGGAGGDGSGQEWDPTNPRLRLVGRIGRYWRHLSLLPPSRSRQRHTDVEQPFWLQVTINSFWLRVQDSLDYLSSKCTAHCLEAAVGQPACGRCSGCAAARRVLAAAMGGRPSGGGHALLLSALSLCSPDRADFAYEHHNTMHKSGEPKLRCGRVSVHKLAEMGLCDVGLISTLAVLDEDRHFVVVLRVPHHLAPQQHPMQRTPQKGRRGDGEQQQDQGQGQGLEPGAEEGSAQEGEVQGAGQEHEGPAEAAEGREDEEEVEEQQQLGPSDLFFWQVFEHPGAGGEAQEVQYGQAVDADGRRQCCLPSCSLREDVRGGQGRGAEGGAAEPGGGRPGIRMLLCHRCHAAWYCTPAHQKQHWKEHAPECKVLAEEREKLSAGVHSVV